MEVRWIFMMIYSLLYRIVFFIPLCARKCFSKVNDDHKDVMFVQGAFIPPPNKFPMNLFWNEIPGKNLLFPTIGPVSSIDDRAIQLFKSIDRKKLDSIKFISHSAGCNTVLKLVEYLHNHHCGMIKEGLVDIDVDIDDLHTNPNYNIMFYETDGSPVYISPRFIKKIVLVSPPLAGVEILDDYPEIGNKWKVESFAIATAHLVQAVFGKKSMVCLDDVENRLDHIKHGKSIFKSLTPKHASISSSIGLDICMKYDIGMKRVITHHSYSIRNGDYVKPGAHPVLSMYILLGVNKGKHDGLTSVQSQTYKLDCNCKYEGDVYTCPDCKSIYADIDHFCISIGSTKREIEISGKVWSKVIDYIENA